MTDFKPILYLKSSCPFCLKVAAFLSEIGRFEEFEIRTFWPGEPEDAAIRRELEGKTEKMSFPALQFAPGEFMTESDAIIERFAQEGNIDPAKLPFLSYIVSGPMRRMREQFARIRELESA